MKLFIATLLLLAEMLNQEPSDIDEHKKYIKEVCAEYSICPETIEAMIEIESEWDASAVSKCGALGLMQIIPKWQTARMERLGIDDLMDAEQNILCGVDYLAELCETYGNIEEALMFYNMGYRGVELYEDGIVSKYAEDVLQRSIELENEHRKENERKEIWKRLESYRLERSNAISRQ